MAASFTRGTNDKRAHAVGDMWIVEGTLTLSGSYATGGESLDVAAIVKEAGSRGSRVFPLTQARGHSLEFDNTNKKLKLYASANTEHAAAAYNAALTASAIPVAFLVSAN